MSLVQVNRNRPDWGRENLAWIETDEIASIWQRYTNEESCVITMKNGRDLNFGRWAKDVAKELQVPEQPDLPANIIAILKELVSNDDEGPDIPRRMVSQIKGYLSSMGIS